MGKSSGGIRNAGKNPRKNLTSEQSKEFHNAAALGLFNSAVRKGDSSESETNSNIESSKRIQILEASLKKKEEELQNLFDNHFGTWKQTNGQPMNDKRNGGAFFNKIEKQNEAIRNKQASIQKTKDAIENEKGRIGAKVYNKNSLPNSLKILVENKEINQWSRHPNTFFVSGVKKARIVFDPKTNSISHKFSNTLQNGEERKKFVRLYNELYKEFNENNAYIQKKLKRAK